jgi:type IV pilus assembly protein PilC
MPKFRYVTVDQTGRQYKGTFESASFQTAIEELRAKDLWIIELFDVATRIISRELKFGSPKVKTEQFTVFCRQLATMYKAGISLVEAVRILGEQTQSKKFRKIILEVAEEMQRGTQFSVAAGNHPSIFNTVFISMVRAGEVSGNLDVMLERLAKFFEKEHNTMEKVKSAMIYPVIMGVMACIVVTIMMIFVIPRFVANFEAMGIELPLPTRIVIAISEWIQAYWFIVPFIMFSPSLLMKLMKKFPKGHYVIDYLKLRVPVFGKLQHKQAIARFSRTFSSLFAAAVPLLQAMTIVAKVVDNAVISRIIEESREGLRSGQSMAEPFRKTWLFPPMVVHMMAIGEKSGSLDSMLEKVADFYENDVDTMADRLKSLLEPLMIVFLTLIVGGIVLSIMLPMFKIMGSVG